MTGRVLTGCGMCGSHRIETVLSLGSSPPTCAMPKAGRQRPETHYPLELLRCADCTLVQLSVVADPAVVFPANYPYSSRHSPQLHANFENLAASVGELGPLDLVVDIGANDGTLLSKFTGCRTIGVEPTDQESRIKGTSYRAFFTEELAREIRRQHGPAKVVTACNVLAHVDDIVDVMRGINVLLEHDGLLVCENHDLGALVDGCQWDFVYHEHLRYFSPSSFHHLLNRHRFGLKEVVETGTHGGSFRAFARKGSQEHIRPTERSYDFAELRNAAATTRRLLRQVTSEPVWGIGATARATTVINYCGLDVEDVTCVCEVPGSDKIGRYVPGTRIPVVPETRLLEEQPPKAVLFSWHLADVIIPKLRDRGYRGEILTPNQLVYVLA